MVLVDGPRTCSARAAVLAMALGVWVRSLRLREGKVLLDRIYTDRDEARAEFDRQSTA